MEIHNTTFFLGGIIVLVLGSLIIIFDYPQILYFEQIPPDAYFSLTPEERDIHQRLFIEIFVGLAILAGGALLIILSMRSPTR